MKRVQGYALFIGLAFLAGIAGSYTFNRINQNKNEVVSPFAYETPAQMTRSNLPLYTDAGSFNETFAAASEKARPAVVFIKSIQEGSQRSYSYWDLFFDFFTSPGPQSSSGSGVIITEDGYIVTNHHVVKDADKIEVVINNRKKNYPAELIGSDPSTDLALLKISADKLTAIEFTNSDNIRVGEWVLAVGNPFNLNSTVTSGIVSAKGRNINVSKDNLPIESFIQTDAAINPGNSGGALVDLNGKLVGINAAILSKTGSYSGYGFAIPSNIVMKIVRDLKEFGMVQRAFVEADVSDIDEQIATRLKDERLNGVYVSKVIENGNADKSGLKKEDIIIRINEAMITDRASFDEHIAYYRPGDKVKLGLLRQGKATEISIQLVNSEGEAKTLKDNTVTSAKLGASFRPLSKVDKNQYGIDYGIRVSNIKNGLIRNLGLPNGFIILSVNNQRFDEPQELITVLENFKGVLSIKGITPEGWMTTRTIRIY
jgi:serine protease Do